MKSWNSEYYDKNSIMQYRTAMNMLEALPIKGHEAILDVGSGSGKITAKLAEKTKGQIVGLDLSEDMVRFACEHYKAKNLAFIVGNVTKMQFKNQFDIVVSFWTLSWVEDQYIALRNIVNSLKEGGQLFLMYPMRHDVYDIADKITQQNPWSSYFYNFKPRPFFSEISYHQILEKLNISFTCNRRQLVCKFNDYAEMESSIRSWMSYLDKLPDERRKTLFLADIIDEYLRVKNSSDYLMHFNVLEINGIKMTLQLQPGKKTDTVVDDNDNKLSIRSKL
jgi:ubiquinone/menaquinone biosynthesis C-methylase UbiE